jgi:hypothetical protein
LADLGLLALLPASLAGYVTVLRPFVYMLYIAAGARRLRTEGRDFSEAEAREIGRQQVINTLIDFACLRITAIWEALPEIGLGIVGAVKDFRLHADMWWRGRVRDYRRAKEWLIACFRDRRQAAIDERRAQADEAGVRRAALLATEQFDYDPIIWDNLPVDKEHARLRDEYEEFARNPRKARLQGLKLEPLTDGLIAYGDNPLAIRRGGVETATVAPQGFLAAGTVAAVTKTGLAWLAPRAIVFAIAACIGLFFYAKSERAARIEAQTARESVEAKFAVAAKAIDARDTLVTQTRTQCLAEISSAAKAAKDKAAADTATKLRRQKLAQDKAAAGGAPVVIDPSEWMRSISGAEGGGDSAAPANPDSGQVSGSGAGPAAAPGADAVPAEPVPGAG